MRERDRKRERRRQRERAEKKKHRKITCEHRNYLVDRRPLVIIK